MSEPDQATVTTSAPPLTAAHRTKLRVGFTLCSSAFALSLAFVVVSFGAVQLASSSDAKFGETHDFELKLAGNVAGAAIDALLIAGLACLYRTRSGSRWRMVSTITLALLGVDVTIVCFDIFGTDAAVMELTRNLGLTLNWVVLWLIAVLAAETAETMERPDITHQTEVTGRLIIWGGVAWLAYLIWSFDPKVLGKLATEAALDDFSVVLFYASWALQLFALGRTMFFCGGLAAALSPTSDQTPPAQTV